MNATRRSLASGITAALLTAAGVACSGASRDSSAIADTANAADSVDTADTLGIARIAGSRPTVVAFFIVPDRAVDTMPDLAVQADDWNVAMAAVGDSMEARGIEFALVTGPRLRIGTDPKSSVMLTLGPPFAGGYVFVEPGKPPCVRSTPLDPDSVAAVAVAHFAGRLGC